MGNLDDIGNIFDEDDEGFETASMIEVMEHFEQLLEARKCTPAEALDGLLNLMAPGSTKNSHDVRSQFMAVMYALNFGELGEHFGAIWLSSMPWGIGFAVGIDPDKPKPKITEEGRIAIIKAMYGILRTGSINAEITDDYRIRILHPDGESQDVDLDSVVTRFREEIDQELGPDAPVADRPDISGWMKRWMGPREEEP